MSKCPSLRELQDRDRNARMEAYRPQLLKRAAQYGLKFKPDINTYKLARLVHDEDDRRAWPALMKRADSLGVPTHSIQFTFRGAEYRWFARWCTQVSLDCYAVEDHRTMLKRFGYTGCT